MSSHPIPLNELTAAVQKAVEQAVAKHGAVSIDKLWFGFVAPENLATQQIANEVAAKIGREAGVPAQGIVAQPIAHAAGAAEPKAVQGPGHIIGLVYAPKQSQ